MQRVKQIEFKGAKTVVTFFESDQIRGYNEIVEDETRKKTTLIRHKHFVEAFEQLTPHLLIRLEIASTMDRIDRPIEADWFKKDHWRDDNNHRSIKLDKVEFGGTEETVSVKLWGHKTTSDGTDFPIVTDFINFANEEGSYEYPLADILQVQVETLDFEAKEFVFNKKTGATAVQTTMRLNVASDKAAAVVN